MQGPYLRNNLPKSIKDGPYVVTFGGYKSIGTRWKALCANGIIAWPTLIALMLNTLQKISRDLSETTIS